MTFFSLSQRASSSLRWLWKLPHRQIKFDEGARLPTRVSSFHASHSDLLIKPYLSDSRQTPTHNIY